MIQPLRGHGSEVDGKSPGRCSSPLGQLNGPVRKGRGFGPCGCEEGLVFWMDLFTFLARKSRCSYPWVQLFRFHIVMYLYAKLSHHIRVFVKIQRKLDMFPKRQNKKNHPTIKNRLRNGWLGLFQTFLHLRLRRMQLNCQDEMCKATAKRWMLMACRLEG